MAKVVYDPTADRKAEKHKQKVTFTFDPKEGVHGKATVVKHEEKVAEPSKPKEEKAAKKTEEKKPARTVLKFTDEQLIAALKEIGKPATSREISDKLSIADPDQGRAYVRREMARLINEKKVEAVESEKKNIGKLYKLQ
jgi:hypothetical protein